MFSFQLARMQRLRFISLVPRGGWRLAVSEAGTMPAALCFCVRSGNESEDSRTAEEHVVCHVLQEDGKSGWEKRRLRNMFIWILLKENGARTVMWNEEPRTKLVGLGTCHFLSRRWKWAQQGLCAKCWTEHNGGVSSARTFRLEQARRRKRGELQSHPSGDCCVEQVMRRKVH